MKSVLFEVVSKKKGLQELIKSGLTEIYFLEDNENKKLFIGGLIRSLPEHLLYSQPAHEPETIDWKKQSALHSPYYKEGLLHIPLKEFGFFSSKTLLLEPGEGFGDLSHPTTSLMLRALAEYGKEKPLLDVGSGSGILTLAHALDNDGLAAGIDCCPSALALSKKNALLNGLSSCLFSQKLDTSLLACAELVVAINMIWSDQKNFLLAYPNFSFSGLWICSGLLDHEVERYLSWLPFKKIHLLKQSSDNGWASLVIKINDISN